MICGLAPQQSLAHLMAAALFLVALAFMSAPATNAASAPVTRPCKDRRVAIHNATASEPKEICAALMEVVRYFVGLRFRFDPTVSVIVRPPAAEEDPALRMHGYFDPALGTVVVNRSVATPWGLERSPVIAASFLRHEFVHVAVHRILRGDQSRLRREWHEFIAYAVQIALMEHALRERVLAGYPDALALEDLAEVNEFTYGVNPDRFAVAAYRTYLARGGAAFVAKLLRFQIVPPPLSYPFPVLPGEIGR